MLALARNNHRRIGHTHYSLVVKLHRIYPTLRSDIFGLQQFAGLPAYVQTHIKVQGRVRLVAHHSIYIIAKRCYAAVVARRNGVSKTLLLMFAHQTPLAVVLGAEYR